MTLPVITENMSEDELDAVVEKATSASAFLKAISHEGRLMILCHLVSGEKSGSKLDKAKKLNVTILSEAELLKLIQ